MQLDILIIDHKGTHASSISLLNYRGMRYCNKASYYVELGVPVVTFL
jgi:hypothetical protein